MENYQRQKGERLSPTLYDFYRPCRKCGSTKLDAIGSPLLICLAARLFGFQLCTCAGCHRKRLSRVSAWNQAS